MAKSGAVRGDWRAEEGRCWIGRQQVTGQPTREGRREEAAAQKRAGDGAFVLGGRLEGELTGPVGTGQCLRVTLLTYLDQQCVHSSSTQLHNPSHPSRMADDERR